MRRIVFQSHRENDRPKVIDVCIESVRDWAEELGLEYRFYHDDLFDRVPDWIKEKASHHKLPMSDLARLVVAKELLADGFDRVLWVDADVILFAPHRMAIPWEEQVAWTREVWVYPDSNRRVVQLDNTANAVSLFGREQSTLDFLIERHLRFAASRRKIDRLDFGTRFLSAMQPVVQWSRIESVGMASLAVLRDMGLGDGPYLRALKLQSGAPLAAINLCSSHIGAAYLDFQVTEEAMLEIAERLMATNGAMFDRS